MCVDQTVCVCHRVIGPNSLCECMCGYDPTSYPKRELCGLEMTLFMNSKNVTEKSVLFSATVVSY